jgi:4-alpha-glucanotransferase
MRIGVVGDLAVGVHPAGADSWTLHDVLARGIEVGAPPDALNQLGQGWSEPPFRPDRLEETGYAAYRTLLRTMLAHTGGLRIDHILGLFRLWWIPSGRLPTGGTYVYYDHDAMVGILALEARRAGVIVVGEDVGVVLKSTQRYLAERGIAGNSITWFENEADEVTPRAPEDYRPLALAVLTTHDLPPTRAFLAGDHIAQRAQLGLLDVPEAVERAAARDQRDRTAGMLVARGFLAEADRDDDDAMVLALHRFLFATPSIMVGVALVDLVGEARSQNLPGTYREYPNWSVPLADREGRAVFIEDLAENPTLCSIMSVIDDAGTHLAG